MGQTIHQEDLEGEHSRVKALTCRIHHILENGGNDEILICMYSHDHALKAVTPMDMIQSIRRSVKTLKLDEVGIDPDRSALTKSRRDNGPQITWRIRYNHYKT